MVVLDTTLPLAVVLVLFSSYVSYNKMYFKRVMPNLSSTRYQLRYSLQGPQQQEEQLEEEPPPKNRLDLSFQKFD